jgi:hypothetical protein
MGFGNGGGDSDGQLAHGLNNSCCECCYLKFHGFHGFDSAGECCFDAVIEWFVQSEVQMVEALLLENGIIGLSHSWVFQFRDLVYC